MKCHYGVCKCLPDLTKVRIRKVQEKMSVPPTTPFKAENSITSAKSAFFAQRRRRITNQPTAVLSNYVFGWWWCGCVCVCLVLMLVVVNYKWERDYMERMSCSYELLGLLEHIVCTADLKSAMEQRGKLHPEPWLGDLRLIIKVSSVLEKKLSRGRRWRLMSVH